MTEEKTIEAVYEDRNRAALAFAALANYHPNPRLNGCWKPDGGEDADAPEWAIVYVALPTGQVSWHVPREMAESSGLPRKHIKWDGHDRREKNARLMAFCDK